MVRVITYYIIGKKLLRYWLKGFITLLASYYIIGFITFKNGQNYYVIGSYYIIGRYYVFGCYTPS